MSNGAESAALRPHAELPRLRIRLRRQALREAVLRFLLLIAALVSIATTVGIVAVLVSESVHFFRHVSSLEFATGTQWTPLFENPRFGILPLLAGTLVTAGVAMLIAIPCGTIIALYLSEYASPRVRESVKPMLEVLEGIPSVVFGYFALLFMTPLLQRTILPDLPGFNMLSAGLVMGIGIIPYVSSVSEDAMRAVPMSLREAAYGMGATRLQCALRVVLPAAFSGVAASWVLGISRGVGETMTVAIAAGLQPNFTWNPLEPAATITSYIVQVALGDVEHGSVAYQTIFAAGLTLFLLTLIFTMLGTALRSRFREAYQ
jgi:phosphate transport system permease protein